jgi:hypothetical protein
MNNFNPLPIVTRINFNEISKYPSWYSNDIEDEPMPEPTTTEPIPELEINTQEPEQEILSSDSESDEWECN